MYINITYRFEVRVRGFRAQFTENKDTAERLAKETSLIAKRPVVVIDNDAVNPVYGRAINGHFFQVLR